MVLKVAAEEDLTGSYDCGYDQGVDANSTNAPTRGRLLTWDGSVPSEARQPSQLRPSISQGQAAPRRTSSSADSVSNLTRSLTAHLIVEKGESQFLH